MSSRTSAVEHLILFKVQTLEHFIFIVYLVTSQTFSLDAYLCLLRLY
ncbi:unnamed protein product [Brassica oleracea var. botrytis]